MNNESDFLALNHKVVSNGVNINVLEVAPEQVETNAFANSKTGSINHLNTSHTLIMLHGLRDTAWSLMPIAETFAMDGFSVLLPELRGHGASDHSEAYSINDYILDLYEVVTQRSEGSLILFGHSLGGHIVSKFAALFPERIQGVILVEGLGPPKRSNEKDGSQQMRSLRFMLLNRLKQKERRSRPMGSINDAAEKLRQNNPRLLKQESERIATHLVKKVQGGLHWVFDSRANSVFVGVNLETNIQFWREIQAPVCVISGRLSYEYWSKEMATEGNSGHFAENELEQRSQAFPRGEHHWLEHSGHMAHYDEPTELTALCKNFVSNLIHS
jgi:pimeloyl-ACP methyl ester carboxylesterase